MKTMRAQSGFSLWGIAFNILILGGFLVVLLRMAPAYLEYMTIKDIMQRAADGFDPKTETLHDIKTHIGKLMNTSQVKAITMDQVKIVRENGKVTIDARYESRFPMFWIVDGVMKFDDLLIQID